LRAQARQALRDLAARKDLGAPVITTAMRVLEGESRHGVEQAAIVLGQLDHKPAADRLLELLRSPRPEVCVAAAWALRALAVPKTLAPILAYVQEQVPPLQAGASAVHRPTVLNVILDHQLSQLVQLLGKQKYKPADPVLRPLIPHQPPWTGPETRAAAVWALGWIHEGESVPQLTTALLARFNDVSGRPPEEPRVRLMCAITFGRLKARQVEANMRQGNPGLVLSRDPIGNACGWAVAQMTGEPLKDPKIIEEMQLQSSWFLIPLDRSTPGKQAPAKPDQPPPKPGGR
jgi:HEAT repeat protein